MAEEVEKSLLSWKDFEEREIKIDRNWSRFDALVAVASLASKKLEEEKIRKGKQKILDDDQRNGHFRFLPWKLSDHRNNSPSTEGIRISDKKQIEKALKKPVSNDLCSTKGQGFSGKLMGEAIRAGIRISNSLKTDDDDGDWVGENTKQEKKKKKRIIRKDCQKPIKRQKIIQEEIPGLPQEFKEKIQQMNGSKIGLVIQKRLYYTDTSGHHYRLSIPLNQILSEDFLTDDEKRSIENEDHINVKLIEPLLQVSEMKFKRWEMAKDKDKKDRSKSSFCYVLINKWNQIKDRNNLKVNDKIQIWKFRSPDEQLCFALVLVDDNGNEADGVEKSDQASEGDGSNNGSSDQSPAS